MVRCVCGVDQRLLHVNAIAAYVRQYERTGTILRDLHVNVNEMNVTRS